jgi:hypothetical protein
VKRTRIELSLENRTPIVDYLKKEANLMRTKSGLQRPRDVPKQDWLEKKDISNLACTRLTTWISHIRLESSRLAPWRTQFTKRKIHDKSVDMPVAGDMELWSVDHGELNTNATRKTKRSPFAGGMELWCIYHGKFNIYATDTVSAIKTIHCLLASNLSSTFWSVEAALDAKQFRRPALSV